MLDMVTFHQQGSYIDSFKHLEASLECHSPVTRDMTAIKKVIPPMKHTSTREILAGTSLRLCDVK